MTSLRRLFLSILALICLTILISCNPTKTLSEANTKTHTDISVQEAYTMIQDNQDHTLYRSHRQLFPLCPGTVTIALETCSGNRARAQQMLGSRHYF